MDAKAVIIVTGASRGIGAAITRRLLQAQTTVVAVARTPMDGHGAATGHRRAEGTLYPVSADVADPSACERVIDEAVQTFGRLDALVNNAGVLAPVARLADADPDMWRHNLAVACSCAHPKSGRSRLTAAIWPHWPLPPKSAWHWGRSMARRARSIACRVTITHRPAGILKGCATFLAVWTTL